MSKLTITKLKKESILRPEFEALTENNEILFSHQGIAVIYAPNGTGKTTISNILLGETATEFVATYDDAACSHLTGTELFHVIPNQVARNIIAGDTDEFLLGENIALERKNKANLDEVFAKLLEKIQTLLKENYKIAKQTALGIKEMPENNMRKLLSKVAKKGVRVSEVDIDTFVAECSKLVVGKVAEHDEEKLRFFIEDISDEKKSTVIKVKGIILDKLTCGQNIRIVEQNGTAVNVLEKYSTIPNCVVCDTPDIDHVKLIEAKKEKSAQIIQSLNQETKKVFEKIVPTIKGIDPFGIKETLLHSIEVGEVVPILVLLKEFDTYQEIVQVKILNDILAAFGESKILDIYNTYQKLLKAKIELQQDDEILIKEIISESLDRNVILERDENKNIIIKLDDKNLIGTTMNELYLSTGEQNFISLAFELLKAKKQAAPIIVMDDPISSFDSIYKNKIAFCIIKILEKKKQIIFTHNTDLVRLLDVQRTHCFNLYLLCNDSSEECGFIPVCANERMILLYLDKLLDLLRSEEIHNEISNEKMYIMSLVPFMRAIIKIISPPNKKSLNDSLTALMHGYEEQQVDITKIYNTIFQKSLDTVYKISAQDILEIDIDNLEFMRDNTAYPLLYKTLRHTLTYLYLRLSVERMLRNQFPSKTRRCELLGDFIARGLSEAKYQSERIRLSSKKTLLNEFNHYEGNFNIFQPAIDITESNLARERGEIMAILASIQEKE